MSFNLKRFIKETLEEKASKQYLEILTNYYDKIAFDGVLDNLKNKKIPSKTDRIKNVKIKLDSPKEEFSLNTISKEFLSFYESLDNFFDNNLDPLDIIIYIDELFQKGAEDKKFYDVKFFQYVSENNAIPPKEFVYKGKTFPSKFFVSKYVKSLTNEKYLLNIKDVFKNADVSQIYDNITKLNKTTNEFYGKYLDESGLLLKVFLPIYKTNRNIFDDLIKDKTMNMFFNGYYNDYKKQKDLMRVIDSINKNEKPADFYFEVTDKVNDFLGMSLTPNFNNCQNINIKNQKEGLDNYGKLLANVFDTNTKIAILYEDKPYKDCYGVENEKTLISRSLIRHIKGKNYYDETYSKNTTEEKKFVMFLENQGFINIKSYFKSDYESMLPNSLDVEDYRPYMDNAKHKIKTYDIETNEENIDKILEYKDKYGITNEDDLMIFDKILYKDKKDLHQEVMVYKKINEDLYFIFLKNKLYVFKTTMKTNTTIIKSIKDFLDRNP